MILHIKRKTKFNLQPIRQPVEVTFNYSVHFTNGIFNLDNPLLAQVIANDGEAKPKKVIALVDARLLEYRRGLLQQFHEYSDRHSDILTLSWSPLVVPGGEEFP